MPQENSTLEELYEQKEILKNNLESLIKQENSSQKNIDSWKRKRDDYKIKRQNIAKTAKKLREERDRFNQEIKDLKKVRETATDRFQSLRTELVGAREDDEKLRELLGRKEHNITDLQAYLKELNWKQQTSSLTVEEEENLIREIEILEDLIRSRTHTKLKSTEEKEILKLQASNLRELHDEAHERIINLVNTAQSLHEKLMPLNEEMSKLYEKEQEAHDEFVRLLNEKDQYQPKIEALKQEISLVNDQIQSKRKEKVNEEVLVKEKTEQKKIEDLLERNKKGEKLSVEELEFLFARGIFPPNP